MHQALPVPIDVENKGVALPEATELAARGGSGSGAVDGGGGSGGGGSGFLLSLSLGGGPGVSFVDHDVGGHREGRGGHHRKKRRIRTAMHSAREEKERKRESSTRRAADNGKKCNLRLPHKTADVDRKALVLKKNKMTSSAHRSASPSLLRDLCHALTGDYGSVFSLVDERGGEAEPSGKENGEAILPQVKTRPTPSTSTPSSPNSLDDPDLDALDALDDRALASRRHRRTRHSLRARLVTSSDSNSNSNKDSGEQQQLSSIASLGATAAFLEAAARVLTSSNGAATAAAPPPPEACAFGWELSRVLEDYRECVLELEARASEEEEAAAAAAAAAEGNGNQVRAPSSPSSSSSSSSLPLPVPRIRLHLGEWPVVLEEVATLAELALESVVEEGEGEKKKTKQKPSAVPPAAALARATAALSRCGAPRVEAAASRLSSAIERAQLLALSRWCARGEGPPAAGAEGGGGGGAGGGSWVVSREAETDDPFSSFELVPAALPPFLSAEAARDALFVGCAARAFSSGGGRRGAGEGDYDGGEDGDDAEEEEEEEEEETRSALLSLLSSEAAPGDDSRLPATTIRPTAAASALAAARGRAERRLFRRCFSSSPAAAAATPTPSLLRAALESLRRVALLGDAALWGTALRSGHLRAALLLERTAEKAGSGSGGGGKNVSSALEAAADDARGAATPAALRALFSPEAPLRLSLVLEEPNARVPANRIREGGGKEGEEEEEALWSRLRVRREGAAAWPLGLLSPLFSSPPRSSEPSGCETGSSPPDPWRTVDSLFSTLLALERASLSLGEAHLSLRSAARGGRTLPLPFTSAAAAVAAGNGGGNAALLPLWRAHRDASFAVRGALSHLREDVLAPADRELDAVLLRLQGGGGGRRSGGGAGPWTLAATALGRWRSRVASSSLRYSSSSSSSSSSPVADALRKLCEACHSIRRAVELASFLEGEEGEGEEEEEDGNAWPLAAAKASALLGAAATAGEAARALAAAAAAEAPEVLVNDDDDDFAATHRAMLLGRVSFG